MDDEVTEVTAYGSTLSHPELAAVGDVNSAVAILRFASGAPPARCGWPATRPTARMSVRRCWPRTDRSGWARWRPATAR